MNVGTARPWYTSLVLGCTVMLTGCALQRIHYKSMTQMQEETSTNYSQQVLNAIIGVCDNAKLPTLFSVEAGASTWSPVYSGNATASIPTLIVGQTTVGSLLSGGESVTAQLQYNDFGSAAMSRAVSLYHLLCFEIQYGKIKLPNGMLATVVDESDSPERFLLWNKRRNGRYLGVSQEKREQFLHFAHDVTYWTRHATPELDDLSSMTGKLFRFSAEYPNAIANLVSARLSQFQIIEALNSTQAVLNAKQQAFDALKQEVRTSKAAPLVLQTLLQTDLQELTALGQAVKVLSAERSKLEDEALGHRNRLIALQALLAEMLTTLKRLDPALASLDVAALMAEFHQSAEAFINGDQKQLRDVIALPLPQVSGTKARESVDKLYRERFESLPQSFTDPRRQSSP